MSYYIDLQFYKQIDNVMDQFELRCILFMKYMLWVIFTKYLQARSFWFFYVYVEKKLVFRSEETLPVT